MVFVLICVCAFLSVIAYEDFCPKFGGIHSCVSFSGFFSHKTCFSLLVVSIGGVRSPHFGSSVLFFEQESSADQDWEHDDKILEPPKFAFSTLNATSAEFVPRQFLNVKAEEPKMKQVVYLPFWLRWF